MNMQTLPSQTEIEAALGLDKRSRRRRSLGRLLWLIAALCAIAGGLWWYVSATQSAGQISYDTAPVSRQTIVVKVQATGNVQPTTQVDVSSERSGVIRTVNVDANSLVRKGDVLAELDTERLQAELTRLNAALTAAQARLADAKATQVERDVALERAQRLSRQGISAAQDLDTARAAQARAGAAVLAAEADIDVAKADIVMQKTDIEKTRILSPVNGIVLKRSAEPGQTVASSFQAPVLFTLAEDLTKMQLEANVDEADIGQVKAGQKANFTVDAYPGQSFPAIIDTIEFSPNVTDNVVTYKAVLTVDNSAMLLRPGMTATAQIVTQEVSNALAVPNAALRYAPPRAEKPQGWSVINLFIPRMPRSEKQAAPAANGERTLYVLENGAPKAVTVKAGVSDGKMTEIVSGDLAAGAQVITASRQAAK